MIDIRQARFLDIQTEMADPMNCNHINLHFLSYFKYIFVFFKLFYFILNYFNLRMTRTGMSSKSTYPKSLFFTFKFYRFPETTTSRFERVY
jgi:hypothetical protein